MRRIKITRGNLLPPPDWNQFKQFLLHGMNDKTAAERIRYSKQFVSVLTSGDASPLMQVTPDKRIHAMKGLASLARFTGQYDYWMQIKRRYNLTWTSGRENLTAFQRFFDDSRTLDSMLQWVREAIQVVPPHMGKIIRFNTLTGLRPNEAIAAVRLLNTRGVYEHQYYNTERQTLEHFRFHEVFLRRTKSAYVSIVTKEMLSAIAPLGHKHPTYEAIVQVRTFCSEMSPWVLQEGIRFLASQVGYRVRNCRLAAGTCPSDGICKALFHARSFT